MWKINQRLDDAAKDYWVIFEAFSGIGAILAAGGHNNWYMKSEIMNSCLETNFGIKWINELLDAPKKMNMTPIATLYK